MAEKKARKEEGLSSNREIFSLSGPTYLTSLNWQNFDHRRSVAASLVQGVCVLERDRQRNCKGPQALAPLWWDFFKFQLTRLLIDDVDNSIFGAIFEFKHFDLNGFSAQSAPKYVIAFRGTITKASSISRDLKLDLLCIRNRLHQSSRFQLAIRAVQDMVAISGATNIWLAGHSLGSAIALLVGKDMTKIGSPIETYLFNPPFLAAPIEKIKNEKLKHSILFASNVVKSGFSVARKTHLQRPQQDETFVALSAWVPYLFLNPADHICSGYIGFFEQKEKMDEVVGRKIEKLATKTANESVLPGSHRINSEQLHVIPSAYLTINVSESLGFKQAHGIHQWWNPDVKFQHVLYRYK